MALLVFFGGLSDPFMYFVGGLMFVYRIFSHTKDRTFTQRILSTTYITIPLIVAFCLYVYQIINLGQVDTVIDKFFIRTSDHHNSIKFNLLNVLFHYKIDKVVVLVLIFAILSSIKIFKNKIIFNMIKNKDILIIFSISIFIHTIVFLNHSAIHNFSIMKYQVLFSIIMGICLACMLFKNKSKLFLGIAIVSSAILFFSAVYTIVNIYNKHEIYNIELANIIKNNHKYDDIFISPEFEIPVYPPQLLSISDKRIYLYKENVQGPLLKDFGQYFGKANFHYVISDEYLTEKQIKVVRHKYHELSVSRFNNVNMPNILILDLGKQINPAEFLKFVRTIASLDSTDLPSDE